jgi:gluconokinase
MIVVLMGVCGSGKTVVGQALATDLGWPFFDGDDFHPPANVAKMAAGTPLVDADRWPWLDRLAAEMAAMNERGADAVLACSALKNAYRDRIGRAGNVRFVYLEGDYDTIAARLATRAHRYMPPTLLASQFATLEEPEDAIVIDVRDSVPVQIAKIRTGLKIATSVGRAFAGPASAGRSDSALGTPPEGGPTFGQGI